MESGNPIFYGDMNQTYAPIYENFTDSAGCGDASDSLQCLRELPFAELNAALNTSTFSSVWTPQIDGDIIARYSSDQIAEGAFVKVPIIDGTTADEGTSFAPEGLNTTAQFRDALMCKYSTQSSLVTAPLTTAQPATT